MAKKKLQQHQAPEIPYDQPLSSPYELPIITIIVGSKRYGLPRYLLRKYPQLDHKLLWRLSIELSDVHEDIGHTLVHFLYSGCYETTDSPLDEDESVNAREYRKAVLVYKASVTYGLTGLELLAKKHIKLFGEAMTMTKALRITRTIFPKLPEDETWLPKHIKSCIQHLFVSGTSNPDLDAFLEIFGPENSFEKVMTTMMLEILSSRLHHPDNFEESDNQHSQIEETLIKDSLAVLQGQESKLIHLATQISPEPEDAPAECCPEPEDAPAECCPEPEDAPAECCPEPEDAPAECCPEPEDAPAERCPEPEDAPAECCPEPEDAPAECCPEPEDAPAECCPEPEDAPAECCPEPEDAPAECCPEPEDAPAECCPEPEDAPAECCPEPEDAPAERCPEPEDAPAERCPEPEQAAGNHLSTSKLYTDHLLENIYLYEGWGNLSPKKRRVRTRKLKAKGLPVPDTGGVISTLVI